MWLILIWSNQNNIKIEKKSTDFLRWHGKPYEKMSLIKKTPITLQLCADDVAANSENSATTIPFSLVFFLHSFWIWCALYRNLPDVRFYASEWIIRRCLWQIACRWRLASICGHTIQFNPVRWMSYRSHMVSVNSSFS